MAIDTTIKSIQDIMRQDAGVNGDAQRIEQLGWMLFIKIFSDREKELELVEKNYKSPIPKELQWRTWAENPEGITGNELLAFVDQKLFPTLRELRLGPKADPRGIIIREIFEDAHNYMKSGQLLRQVINKVNEIDFNRSSDRHDFGDIYEKDSQGPPERGKRWGVLHASRSHSIRGRNG